MTTDFLRELDKLIPHPCLQRPFTCEGMPQECSVMVVGENPATPMGVDWWSYWSDETGFDLAKFERHYRERTEKPTTTHRRVELLRSLLRPYGLKCLVTNAFANERPGGHRGGTSNVDVLRLFVSQLPALRFVVIHGKEAKDAMKRVPLPIRLYPPIVKDHFSSRRGMSDRTIQDIAAEIKGQGQGGVQAVSRPTSAC